MRDLPFNQMTTDARSLADRFGAQTTEALIRAATGVQATASDGLATAKEGAAAAGGQIGQIGQGMAEGMQSIALPNTSARVAWRAGRFVGRIEGAVRLAAFGVRFWWRRRQRQRQRGRQGQDSTKWLRVLAQWGPTTIASGYLATQVWTRRQRRMASE